MFSKETAKKSIGFVLGTIGILAYVFAYWKFDQDELPYRILINIADVLVIGVVVGYLSSVAQWAGIFKKDIQDIVFGKQLIGERKDIEIIWNNVTKQLLKNKFSEIHKSLLDAIKHNLPEDDTISYYEDYDADISIRWHDQSKSIIEVTETLSFTLIADSEKEFEYKSSTWTTITENHPKAKEIISDPIIEVDGKSVEIDISNKSTSGCIGKESKIKLKGKKSYNIYYKCTKRYDINLDYIVGLKAQFLINNLTVTLNLPDGIEATFIENGTNRDFDTVKNDKNCIKKRLKGVIFSKQGYIFALKEKSRT